MIGGKRLSKVVYRFGRILAKHRKSKLGAFLGQTFKTLYFGFENHNYAARTNGERRLFEIALDDSGESVVFDVGANVGNWTRSIKKTFPRTKVYCFEPIHSTYNELKENLSTFELVTTENCALGDEKGQVEFNFVKNRPTLSSSFSIDYPNPQIEKVQCDIRTLDEYVHSKAISTIDFLKIDAEGMDHLVLLGAENSLRQKKIRAIQFEYGFLSVETRFLLKDFYEYLTPLGYVVGKIYPTYVDFSPYHRSKENFIGPNMVAVSAEESELIDQLANSDS